MLFLKHPRSPPPLLVGILFLPQLNRPSSLAATDPMEDSESVLAIISLSTMNLAVTKMVHVQRGSCPAEALTLDIPADIVNTEVEEVNMD